GMAGKLTLLSAPAGFGKTTLLAGWARQAAPARRVAWLSLDEVDNDPARFWAYVIAALQSVEPALGQTTLSLLNAPQPPPAEAALTPLLNELAAHRMQHVLAEGNIAAAAQLAAHRGLSAAGEVAHFRGMEYLAFGRVLLAQGQPAAAAALLERAQNAAGTGYSITVEGRLDAHWSHWFDGLSVAHTPTGNTVLSGPVADQAALHGLLAKIRDLGLVLISVRRDEAGAPHGK
ncbi:MAG: hypothetical protein ACE5G8_15755, partial [Anaerolineae bacterium]